MVHFLSATVVCFAAALDSLYRSRPKATGSWPAAALPNLQSWLTTCALAQREQPWRNWPRWPEPAGPSRNALSRPRERACPREGGGGAGPVRGPPLGWLVPAHNSGHAGPRLSHSNQTSGTGDGEKGGHYGLDEELIPVTLPEVRRLLTRLVWTEKQPPDFILDWSWWRRRHQALSRQCHYKRRLSKVGL